MPNASVAPSAPNPSPASGGARALRDPDRRYASVPLPAAEHAALGRAAATLGLPVGSFIAVLARIGAREVRKTSALLRARGFETSDTKFVGLAEVLDREDWPADRHAALAAAAEIAAGA